MIKIIYLGKVYSIKDNNITGGYEKIRDSVLQSLSLISLNYYPTIEDEIAQSFLENYPKARIVENTNTFESGKVY